MKPSDKPRYISELCRVRLSSQHSVPGLTFREIIRHLLADSMTSTQNQSRPEPDVIQKVYATAG